MAVFNKTAAKQNSAKYNHVIQHSSPSSSKINRKCCGESRRKTSDDIDKKSSYNPNRSNSTKLQHYWYKTCFDLNDKSNYLLFQTNPKTIAKTFRHVELNNELLEEFIETIHYIAQNFEKIPLENNNNLNSDLNCTLESSNDNLASTVNISDIIYQWLKALPKCNRFSINISFLSDKHKVFLRFIMNEFFDQMIIQEKHNNVTYKTQGSNRITESSIKKLKNIYGID